MNDHVGSKGDCIFETLVASAAEVRTIGVVTSNMDLKLVHLFESLCTSWTRLNMFSDSQVLDKFLSG